MRYDISNNYLYELFSQLLVTMVLANLNTFYMTNFVLLMTIIMDLTITGNRVTICGNKKTVIVALMWIINKQGGYEDINYPAETCVI